MKLIKTLMVLLLMVSHTSFSASTSCQIQKKSILELISKESKTDVTKEAEILSFLSPKNEGLNHFKIISLRLKQIDEERKKIYSALDDERLRELQRKARTEIAIPRTKETNRHLYLQSLPSDKITNDEKNEIFFYNYVISYAKKHNLSLLTESEKDETILLMTKRQLRDDFLLEQSQLTLKLEEIVSSIPGLKRIYGSGILNLDFTTDGVFIINLGSDYKVSKSGDTVNIHRSGSQDTGRETDLDKVLLVPKRNLSDFILTETYEGPGSEVVDVSLDVESSMDYLTGKIGHSYRTLLKTRFGASSNFPQAYVSLDTLAESLLPMTCSDIFSNTITFEP